MAEIVQNYYHMNRSQPQPRWMVLLAELKFRVLQCDQPVGWWWHNQQQCHLVCENANTEMRQQDNVTDVSWNLCHSRSSWYFEKILWFKDRFYL